tara:strand:- start:1166 stop:1699 length:534 start_codon:yes stop_codon:yes gene_type:complete
MKKLTIFIILILIAIPIAYYLISPAFKVVEVNEASPLMVKDSMKTMDADTKLEFEKQTNEMKDKVMEKKETSPSNEILSQGDFKANAHEVAGNAILIESNNEKILRFENFETINGPKLHIYLSTELGDSDFVDLGEIKATKGNVNYKIPSGTDTSKYNKVLVWCKPFKVLFSHAELK